MHPLILTLAAILTNLALFCIVVQISVQHPVRLKSGHNDDDTRGILYPLPGYFFGISSGYPLHHGISKENRVDTFYALHEKTEDAKTNRTIPQQIMHTAQATGANILSTADYPIETIRPQNPTTIYDLLERQEQQIRETLEWTARKPDNNRIHQLLSIRIAPQRLESLRHENPVQRNESIRSLASQLALTELGLKLSRIKRARLNQSRTVFKNTSDAATQSSLMENGASLSEIRYLVKSLALHLSLKRQIDLGAKGSIKQYKADIRRRFNIPLSDTGL